MRQEKRFSVDYCGKLFWGTYRVDGLVIYVDSEHGSADGSLHEYDEVDIDCESPIPAILLFRRILDGKFALL